MDELGSENPWFVLCQANERTDKASVRDTRATAITCTRTFISLKHPETLVRSGVVEEVSASRPSAAVEMAPASPTGPLPFAQHSKDVAEPTLELSKSQMKRIRQKESKAATTATSEVSDACTNPRSRCQPD